MTKAAGLLVLFGALATAGPIVEDVQPAQVESIISYSAFLALAGDSWLLDTVPATFDSQLHYASEAPPPMEPFDPLLDYTPVPEPRSVALMAGGLVALALLGIRRRRRTHSHNL